MALGGFSVTNGRAAAGVVVVRASSTALELESVELGLRNLNRDGVDPYSAHITRVALILTTERECCEQQGSGSAAVSKATAAITTDYSLLDLLSPCQGTLCSIVRATAVRALPPTTRLRDAVTAADLQTLTDFHLTPSCSLHTRVVVCSIVLLYFGARPSSGMARVLVHSEFMRFDPPTPLRWVELTLWKGKTDPIAARRTVTIAADGTSSCPVGILPRLSVQGRYIRVPQRGLNWAPYCGWSTAARSPRSQPRQSMQIGAATTAINGGTPREAVIAHGHWADPAQSYVRPPPDQAVHIGAALSARPCASCPLVFDSSAPRAHDSA
ncbi:hypothetical protein PLESTB_001348500 [Pleodorina starrii]|uniref:Uncharacterized protein n=1 Tax=Pleodorina starrii TaxID=330485 RepID=A0A9W6BV36_9CHLO|nr:hypothetical protein PLESTM_000897000 [Pleodorina starrii]GLC58342.1 hypothetical protein PLESTB_001348500 [Pleodorina starrii]